MEDADAIQVEIELTTTATTDCPEEIGVVLLSNSDEATVGKDNLHGEDLVSGQTVDTRQGGVTTAENITTGNTDSLKGLISLLNKEIIESDVIPCPHHRQR